MNKFFLLIVALFCLSISQRASAQLKGFSIGPYGEIAFPTGDFQKNFKLGGGLGAQADIRLIKSWAATGSIGYMYFRGKDVTDPTTGNQYKVPDLKAVPIRVGIKYRPIPLLYLKLESGTAALSGKNYSGSAFILSPGVGLKILGFDFQAKYEAWMKDGTKSFFGLKAGWNF
ncbi:MAG: outer membrane beta-barrel protein [Niabella sp.]|nr:outer membrane beta-barrel protein [Niabella sp.]